MAKQIKLPLPGNPFTYHPLSHNDSIRVLEIQPSKDLASELHCVLQHVRLSENPAYAVLASTVDDAVCSETLRIKHRSILAAPKAVKWLFGVEDTFPLSIDITPNLSQALKRHRRRDAKRTLWVAALSIDQHDVGERERHVSILARIYTNCQTVVVDLGGGNASTCIGIMALRSFATSVRMHHREDEVAAALEADDALEGSLVCDFRTVCVSGFFGLPWFRQGWSGQRMQEFVLARLVVLRYGTEEVDWDVLERCVQLQGNMAGKLSKPPVSYDRVCFLVRQRMEYRRSLDMDLNMEDGRSCVQKAIETE